MNLRSLLDRVRRPAAPEGESGYWFARHTSSIIFLIFTLALVGGYLAFTIPVSVFPTTNFPRIVIGVDNGVMPIDQMLVTVIRPLEEAVNTVPGLQQVRSITSRGSAEIDLSFDWNADMMQTLQLVDAAVSRAQSSLPSTARIESHRLTFASFPILGYSLTSDTVPQTQLWELATYEIKPRLNRLDGIATVIVQGGQEPEFQITPDPAKLLTAKVTVPDLLEAIRRTNLIDSPGLLERNHQLFLALVNGQVRSPAQIADIVVKTTPAGIPVRIGDVARVGPSVMPVYTRVTSNGKPAVLLNINRQPDSNTMTVADEVHNEVARIQQTLPPGIHLQPFYDQSIIVGESVKSVRDAVLMGIILASIIMVLFLRDWGTSIVAGLVIPVTLLITCIVFKLVGESFNLMTLGGLAAAVGLVIDDAIVVVENIVRHRDLGESGFEAIHSGLREITVPLIGSTVTPIVVFLPLISITGVTGTFFRALAITVAVSLCASLALAMTWTPTLSQYLIHPAKKVKKEGGAAEDHGRFAGVIRFYERWLRHALHHPGQVALLAAGVTLVSFVSYKMLGTDLLPEMDEGGFVIDYVMPAGSSLQETDLVVTHIERMLRELPEVESTSRRTGMQLGLAAVTEANTGDISVKLKHKRSRDIDDIMAEARDKIAQQEPAISVEFIQTLQDMIGDLTGAPEPIQIKLFSPDAALLREWAPRVGEAISKVPGVVDELDGIENTISGPAVSIEVNPMTAARAGFTPE
ncbi:MAG: efflux RND transporter permease subunit, partial [Acidobacteriota bacterium]|nr:efflux RND transporter permease subunit [Acidobacteriota bacterium]